jgi:autotransporter-associated beta strand protein
MKLGCEALEVRITPATSTWTGLAPDPFWTDAGNWSGNVAPSAGDDLVFPVGASQSLTINDYSAGTSFNSITIDAPNYDLQGSQITLTGGISATYGSSSSTIELPTILSGTITVQESGGILAFSNTGVLSGSGSLVESGPGTLYIQTSSTYTGSTTVNNGGILFVSGSIASSIGSEVDTGSIIGGNGTLNDIVSVGGTVGYTNGPIANILTATSLTLDSNSTFSATVNGTMPGGLLSGHDQVVISGALTLNSATLSVPNTSPYSPADGDSIVLITGATSVTGTFNGLPEGSQRLISGREFAITYQGGVGGHDVVLNAVRSTTTTVSSDINPSTFGAPVNLTATVSASVGTPTGLVTFMSGATTLGTGMLNGSGVATYSTSSLPVGSASITAVYGGDTLDFGSTSSILTQTVNQAASTTTLAPTPNPSTYGAAVSIIATVTSAVGTPTGMVSLYNGATLLGTAALDSSGTATFTTSALPVGANPLTATYSSDINYAGSTGTTTENISQAISQTTVTATPNPSVTGQLVTLTATVTPQAPGVVATGTVSFFDGATLVGVVPLDGLGVASLTTSSLAIGSHSITAVYGGVENVAGSTSAVSSTTVTQASTTSVVTSTANPSVFGQATTLTATVTAVAPGSGTPTGSVSFFDGATLLGTSPLDGSGTAALTTTGLAVGSQSITVVYGGDANYSGDTSPVLMQTVSQASTTSVVTSSANPSVFGQPTMLTATVTALAPGSGTPTGSVSFFDGATLLGTSPLDGSGTAALTTTGLTVGPQSITAVYSGDVNFLGATSPLLTQTVVQSATTSIVTAIPNPKVFGQTATLTATVTAIAPGSGTPTGSVSFLDGATLLGTSPLDGSGIATLSTSILPVGPQSITAVYSGDANFLGDTSPVQVETVVQAATTSVVTSSANPSMFGQPTTLTATVTAIAPGSGTPTGVVGFFDGATLLGTSPLDGSGTAALTTTSLSVGTQPITAVYSGDGNFLGDTSPVLMQTVSQASTTSVVTSTPNPSIFGQTVTLSATVTAVAPASGVPTGTVSFFNGATLLGTIPLDGSGLASISTSEVPVGSQPITAVYNGDLSFLGDTSPVFNQTVTQASTSALVTSSVNPSVFGQSTTLTGVISAVAPGVGIPTGTASFFDGATFLGTVTLSEGTATFSTSSLAVGTHPITIVYNGDADFTTSTSPSVNQVVAQSATGLVLTGPAGPTVFSQPATFTVTATAISPGAGTPTGTVTLTDGVNVLGTVSLVNGVGTFTTNSLPVGTTSVDANYNGDLNFAGNSAPSVSQIVNQNATTTTVTAAPSPGILGQSVTLTATVSPVAPGLLSPTGSVSFYDGSTLLGTAPLTVANGVSTAQFSTSSLAIGTHQISAVWSGDPNFIGSTGQASETVNQAVTSVVLTTPQTVQTFGQAIAITAQVALNGQAEGAATGTMTFSEGSTVLAVLPAIAGTAIYAPTGLATGAHVITVTYSGDGEFIGSSAQATQQVVAATTYTTLTTSAQVAIYGQSVTYTASAFTIAPGVGVPTGSIAFYDGSVLLASSALINGQASLTVSATGVGQPHDIHAVYTPDSGNFLTYATGVLHNAVIKSNSTILFYYQVSATGVGFPTTVIATTPGAGVPTGTLTYYVNGRAVLSQPLVNGQAGVFAPRKFAVGRTFSVAYSGDANFHPSASKPIKITPAILNGGSSPIQVFRARAARVVRSSHHA